MLIKSVHFFFSIRHAMKFSVVHQNRKQFLALDQYRHHHHIARPILVELIGVLALNERRQLHRAVGYHQIKIRQQKKRELRKN